MKTFLTILPLILLSPVPLFAQSGGTVTVRTAGELISAIFALNNYDGPRTILLEDGVYTIANYNSFYLTQPDITIRSVSGNRDAVIIQGDSTFHPDGSRTGGTIGNLFGVAAENFTLENVTVGNVANHAVQLQVDIDNCIFRNVRFFNTGEQMLKVASDGIADQSDNGLVEDCVFDYPAGIGPQWYIGGVDAHRARNWTVRRCTFRGIRSPSGSVAEHAIHFWEACINTLVEENVIVDCDRGIGFGLGADSGAGTTGGIIRNNMIYHRAVTGFADVGIGLENAAAVQVYNNTILLQSGYPNAIEYRFAVTTAEIYNNLANTIIRQRDGATGSLGNNLTTATAAWFVAPATADLHLASRLAAVVDQGRSVSGLVADIDGDLRPQGAGIDIGADEYVEAQPATFADWRAANFSDTDLTDDAISGPNADPDAAGLSNFGRYAFNLPARGPVASSLTVGVPATAGGSTYFTINFNRRSAATDLSYMVESSNDLATWTPMQTYAPGTPTRVTVQDTVPMDSAPSRFLRVHVTTP